MPLTQPDSVLQRVERARIVTRLLLPVAAAGCICATVYVAFGWAVSPCEQDIAALQVDCTWPAGMLLLERMLMHLATVGAGMVGAGMLLRHVK